MYWIKNIKFEWGFVEAGNNYTESLIDFYNMIVVLLVLISALIGYWIWYIWRSYRFKKVHLINTLNYSFVIEKIKYIDYIINTRLSGRCFTYMSIYDIKDYPVLEGTWCLVPLGFISLVAYPSIGLEYGISPDITPLVVVKIIAHQWYWVIDIEAKTSPGMIEGNDNFLFLKSDLYSLFKETKDDYKQFYKRLSDLDFQLLKKTVDVNLINSDPNFFRLLAIDNKILLPVNTPIKLIVTSVDVLHSFAIPAWSVKIDAVPGRISEQLIVIERPGLYWGQCSELCGPYHGYMPVVFEVTSYPVFLKQFFIINNN